MHTRLSSLATLALAALAHAAALAPSTAAAQAPAPKAREGSASLGFSSISGNANATTINVAEKLKWALKGWAIGQDLVFFYGEADDKVNANFWNGGVRGERRLTPRLGAYVATRFDRNVLQGVASRFEEGLGFDYKVVETPRDRFTVTAGASWFQQKLAPGTSTTFKRSFPAARVGADYKHNFTELAFFQQTVEYLPNLNERDLYLLNTESSLVAPLTRSLGLKVGYVVRYNAAPPAKDGVQLKKADTFLSSGVTYSF